MQLHVTTDLAGAAGPILARGIANAINRYGRCRIGVAGGSTPRDTFGWLGRSLSPQVYSKLWVTTIDERHLPIDAREPGWLAYPDGSNYRMLQELWLANVPHLPEQILPMSRGLELGADLESFRRGFRMYFDDKLDIVLLGVGDDGHIASLFPNHWALESPELAVAISDSPKPPANRITLTGPVLENADMVVLIARGASKASVIARAGSGDASLPLGRLQPKGEVHWVLDPPAAAKL